MKYELLGIPVFLGMIAVLLWGVMPAIASLDLSAKASTFIYVGVAVIMGTLFCLALNWAIEKDINSKR